LFTVLHFLALNRSPTPVSEPCKKIEKLNIIIVKIIYVPYTYMTRGSCYARSAPTDYNLESDANEGKMHTEVPQQSLRRGEVLL
jgi:hypothetical protein